MINDGGPAFPAHHFDLADGEHGITLRDYFAARIAASMWANADVLKQMPTGTEAKVIAAVSYEQADAMLKERTK